VSEVTERMWRTQVHVLAVIDDLDLMFVEIPGLPQDVLPAEVGLRWKVSDVFPEEVRDYLTHGCRTHARVSLGALSPWGIKIEDWEMPS
jgi:hypothetical protein